MSFDRKGHWEKVYAAKTPAEVIWRHAEPLRQRYVDRSRFIARWKKWRGQLFSVLSCPTSVILRP